MRPVIEAEGLTKRYGDVAAVDGIDFAVEPGESFGPLGLNGAGKSTTMRMVGAVSTRSGGSLRILGLDPNDHGPEIRAQLGVVPQADNLDAEIRARDNLIVYGRYFGLPAKLLRRRADDLLEFAQLADRAKAKVEDLSGGMKRRLTIARADQRPAHPGPLEPGLQQAGRTPKTSLVRRASLEDVFLRLTGRSLIE